MSVEVITDAVHKNMYEKLNGSPETEKEKNRYLNKQKTKFTKNNRKNRQNSRI